MLNSTNISLYVILSNSENFKTVFTSDFWNILKWNYQFEMYEKSIKKLKLIWWVYHSLHEMDFNYKKNQLFYLKNFVKVYINSALPTLFWNLMLDETWK